MDANGAASDTYGTPPTWRAAAASSAGRGRPPARGARPEPLLQLPDPRLELLDARRQRVGRLGAGRLRGSLEGLEARLHEGIRRCAGDRLDAAHAAADGPLRGDDEAADLARRAAMRAAAQLEAVVALDPDGAHLLAVLLVEERVGAAVDGLLHGHHLRPDRQVVPDDAPDLVLRWPVARRR